MLFKSEVAMYYDFSGCYLLYLLLRHRYYISVPRLIMKGVNDSPWCGWRDVVKNSNLVFSNMVMTQKKSLSLRQRWGCPFVRTIVSRLSICISWMNYSDHFLLLLLLVVIYYITHTLTMHTLAYTGKQYRDIAHTYCVFLFAWNISSELPIMDGWGTVQWQCKRRCI